MTVRYKLFGYEGPGFVAYFYFIGFDHISLGLHVCLSIPNVEIHVPFGFLRIGRRGNYVFRSCRGWVFGT